MNAIVQSNGFGPISARFAGKIAVDDNMSAGIEASYGIMKFKGKVWSTSFKGEERPLMRPDGDGPRNSIDVVVLQVSRVKSKIFYAKGYVEGSTEAPDCWSTNGVTPDPQASSKQCTTCAACPQNVWGSRTTEAGKKGKACSDSKRMAIVPADPSGENAALLRNELLGGPMLLRVPAASLAPMAAYNDRMKAANYPYQTVVTRISFDPKEAYPHFVFQAVRPLSDSEADVVVELVNSPQVSRIVAEEAPQVAALPAPQPKPEPLFIGAAVTPEVKAAPAPQPAITKIPDAPDTRHAQAAPAAAPAKSEDFESQLDALISS